MNQVGNNGRKNNINAASSGQQQQQRSGGGVSGSGKSAFKPTRSGARHSKNSSGSNRNSGCSSRKNNRNGDIVSVSSGNNRNNDITRSSGSQQTTTTSSKREDEDGNHVPGTNVVRIMRTVLPVHAKISDGAKESVQECVTEYISLITSEANERCMREHRKTLTPEDLLYAMAKLGFDEYIQPLTLYLNRYRASESERTTVNGEPTVYRAVNYQHLLGSSSSTTKHHQTAPYPPRLPPPMYFNPAHQIAPPPPLTYLVNAADDAMRGFQGFRVAPPPAAGGPVDIAASHSTPVAYAPATGSTSVYPYNAAYINPPPPPPPPCEDINNPGREFFR